MNNTIKLGRLSKFEMPNQLSIKLGENEPSSFDGSRCFCKRYSRIDRRGNIFSCGAGANDDKSKQRFDRGYIKRRKLVIRFPILYLPT